MYFVHKIIRTLQSLRKLNEQTYYYVLMFQFIRVLAHTLLILIILICVLFLILFSIFRACLDHCNCIVASYAYFYLTVSLLFFFPVLVFVVQQLCSHSGWFLLKWSAIGIGFGGAETNCRIAHILSTLLMISY